MIVVLCDDWWEAINCYNAFIAFGKEVEPGWITECDRFSLMVRTDDDLCYIFIDYRFEKVFTEFCNPKYEFISSDRFFEAEGADEYFYDYNEGWYVS